MLMYIFVNKVAFVVITFNRSSKLLSNSHYGIVANMPDCDIVVSEFELQSRYYIHFRANTLGRRKTTISKFIKLQLKD